jgi:phospholipase/lecithinase/hemolysin
MQTYSVKRVLRFTVEVLLFGAIVFPAQAAFTSLYIFGDSVSATTSGPGGTLFYGNRYSNGRVWVEVLAQELGLPNNYWYSTNGSNQVSYTNLSASTTNWSYSGNNWSYWGDYGSNLVQDVNNFTPPTNANTALFIVWVNDADFVGDMENIYPSTNIVTWTNAINQSLANHWTAITNLYAKGVRTLIMPNAVDITEIPQFDLIVSSADKSFIRQRVIDFNAAFTVILSNAMVSLPGLKIYEPDFFALLDNVVANAAAYGLTNALYNGQSIDALEDPSLTDKSLNGPGANYIFWDYDDPTAKLHAVMADVVQQLISPVQISHITALNSSSQLGVANIPIGLNGFVDGTTNLVPSNWAAVANITSTNATQTVLVPASGPMQFYRLRFPFTWSWP